MSSLNMELEGKMHTANLVFYFLYLNFNIVINIIIKNF